jgi:hypothetical protein
MNHIATSRALSLGGELLLPHHGRQLRRWRWRWSRWRWLRGKFPVDRVLKYRLLSPEIGLRWWRRCVNFRGQRLDDLGFLPHREYIGGRAMSEGGPGAHTTWWCGQGGPAPPYGVASPGPSPSLLWTPYSCRKNRRFGFCFVQFREYFLCNFS